MLYWIFVLFKKKSLQLLFRYTQGGSTGTLGSILRSNTLCTLLKFLDYGHDTAQNWSLFYLPHFVPLLCDEDVCEDLNTSLYGAIG